MPSLTEIICSPIYLIGILVTIFYALHLIFSRLLKFDEISYKRLDYLWLSLAVLGLIPHSGEVRKHLFSIELEMNQGYVEVWHKDLVDQINFGTSGAYCRTFISTYFSPQDLEEIQKEYDVICSEFKLLLEATKETNPEETIDIVRKQFRANNQSVKYREEISWLVNLVLKKADDLENAIAERKTYSSKTKSYWYENLWLMLSPLILSIAIAVRLAKVKGEVYLKKCS